MLKFRQEANEYFTVATNNNSDIAIIHNESKELYYLSIKCSANDLRQIADKLDELNGVKHDLPEMLKEQA